MNRRGFFSRVIAVLAVAPLGQLLSAPKKLVVSSMDVTRATHAFWKNQTTDGTCSRTLSVEDLQKTWNACE